MYLTVTVTDENGRYITGLMPDQFMVSEKKVPLKISYFDSLEKPVSLALVLDLSSSIPAVFKNLAIDLTGGKMFFPRTPLEMREITAQIGMELRQQYVIGFEPAVRDNKMHSINVKVVPLKTPAKGTRILVRHRKAYYGH